MKRTLMVVTCAALLGPAQAQSPTAQLPTASEVFRLRSECAALGRRILEENIVGPALYQSQVSYYNPRTNRCYVEITTQYANLRSRDQLLKRHLFDGQTREMLAWAVEEKGQKAGMVFDRNHNTINLTNAGWDDANAYINGMMADDRR